MEHPDTARDTWVTAHRDAEVISHKDLDLGREDEGFRRAHGIKPHVGLDQELWWDLPRAPDGLSSVATGHNSSEHVD